MLQVDLLILDSYGIRCHVGRVLRCNWYDCEIQLHTDRGMGRCLGRSFVYICFLVRFCPF